MVASVPPETLAYTIASCLVKSVGSIYSLSSQTIKYRLFHNKTGGIFLSNFYQRNTTFLVALPISSD